MDEQNFKFSFFGGFNKKSVVDYVTKIVDSFNLEIENLKKDYESKLEQKEQKIADLCANLQQSEEGFKKLKIEFNEFKNSQQRSVDIKKLEEKEALITQLSAENAELKKASSNSKNEAVALEERLKKAQVAAKDRINEIVEQARAKIVAEYNQKMEASKQEVRALRDGAAKEISKILNDSASVAQKMISEAKGKIKQFVNIATQEAKDLVESANLVGQNIIKQSAEAGLSEKKNNIVNRLNLNVEVDNIISSAEKNFKIDEELFGAVKKLNADFLLNEAGKEVKLHLKNDDII